MIERQKPQPARHATNSSLSKVLHAHHSERLHWAVAVAVNAATVKSEINGRVMLENFRRRRRRRRQELRDSCCEFEEVQMAFRTGAEAPDSEVGENV